MQDKKVFGTVAKTLAVISTIFTLFGFMVVMPFVMGVFLMLLWNALVPMLFGLGQITYLQSVGLYVLSGILIKGDFSSLFSSLTGIRMKKALPKTMEDQLQQTPEQPTSHDFVHTRVGS